jgi:hypothetical protein
MRRLVLAALGALAIAAAPARSGADEAADVAEAKAHVRKGAELYRGGKWREAIEEFEAAYRLKPAGALHFNVAQCREKLSEWPGALRAYTDYLREVPEASDRAVVRAAIGKIEQRLQAAGAQALVVYTDPPGAAVLVDGKRHGTTPFHTVLPPGTYALSLQLDGYEAVKQDVALVSSTSRVVDAVLRPAPPAPAPSAAKPAGPIPHVPLPPPPDLRPKPPAPAAAALATKPPAPKRAEKRRVYTWIAAGAAVAAVAAGGWFGSQAQKDADAVDGVVNDGGRARRLADDAKSKARTANVLFVVSGVAGAAGVTLFFVEKRF